MKTNFIVAVKRGKLNKVREIFGQVHENLSHEKCTGKTLYGLAIERRDLEMLSLLHSLTNVSPDVLDLDGRESPMSLCIRYSFFEGMHFLLSKGADINLCNVEGLTLFHIAAMCAGPKTLDFLIKRGAKPDAHSISGQPIHVAAQNGNIEALEYLKGLSGVEWQDMQLIPSMLDKSKNKEAKQNSSRSERYELRKPKKKAAPALEPHFNNKEQPLRREKVGKVETMEKEEGGCGSSRLLAGGLGLALGLGLGILAQRSML